MTGPEFETENPERPVSVAELLARNGSIGAPAVTRRRRRRRGDDEAVTVAELTGEIPIIDDDDDYETEVPPPVTHAHRAHGGTQHAGQVSQSRQPVSEPDVSEEEPDDGSGDAYWAEPEPRWPKSPPQTQRRSGPQRSAYPRPLRSAEGGDAEQPADRAGGPQSGAEGMSPDPIGHYGDVPVDVTDSEVSAAESGIEDSAYVRSYLRGPEDTLFGGQTLADEMARRRSGGQAARDVDGEERLDFGDEFEAGHHRGSLVDLLGFEEDEDEDAHWLSGRFDTAWHGGLVVLQSIVAVAFGAGLFIAFDQLWRWNSIVTLVLSVLVILGLVVGVRVVRKTEDIASTLIAVAVGALITWGPLVLSLQSG
jgi:hypothetical protein